MPEGPLSTRQVDGLREGADRFLAELDQEFYDHFAGHKERFELEPIYERHAELTALETATALGEAAQRDPSLHELWRFTCEGYLGALGREWQERAASAEAGAKATVDGEEIPFRMLRPAISNEPDRDRRRRLHEARVALSAEHLEPVQLEGWRAVHRGARDLGAASYLELFRDRLGMELDRLAADCRAVLDDTQALWETWGDRLFRARLGLGLGEARPWDVPRLLRSPEWDAQFPADGMLPALEATLAGLGIDLRSQENVHLDLDERPLKTPRAFCAPVEVPGRVMLVIQPMGGPDDWVALFHEAGHTEHYAHVDPGLRMEDRRLGDYAVTEGWAALFDRLPDDVAWLQRRLDVGRPEEWHREATVVALFYLRRYAAKLLYELEFHAADEPSALRGRYVELLGDALRIEPAGTDYVADIDEAFYASCYLRSWAFEAQLRDFLRTEFGGAWFAQRDAGSLLRELWALGQRPTAEELLADVTGSTLDMASVVERIRASLA